MSGLGVWQQLCQQEMSYAHGAQAPLKPIPFTVVHNHTLMKSLSSDAVFSTIAKGRRREQGKRKVLQRKEKCKGRRRAGVRKKGGGRRKEGHLNILTGIFNHVYFIKWKIPFFYSKSGLIYTYGNFKLKWPWFYKLKTNFTKRCRYYLLFSDMSFSLSYNFTNILSISEVISSCWQKLLLLSFKMKTTQNHKLYVNKVDVFQFCFGLHTKKIKTEVMLY